MDATAALPRPQHVVLNHMYIQRAPQLNGAVVMGSTHRYKSKYITTVLYKARATNSRIQVVPLGTSQQKMGESDIDDGDSGAGGGIKDGSTSAMLVQ